MKYIFLFDQNRVYEVLPHEAGTSLLTTSNFLVTTIPLAEIFFMNSNIDVEKITEFKLNQTNI